MPTGIKALILSYSFQKKPMQKKEELNRKRIRKERMVVFGVVVFFILAAAGIVYLAIQFGS